MMLMCKQKLLFYGNFNDYMYKIYQNAQEKCKSTYVYSY